ncbi:MAG: hypothetical protein E2O84_03030 [Bacteroidetes bacterium]|nr:MAG: hypothetical protein E2O84_03030 [Bacteroidota bacterium]
MFDADVVESVPRVLVLVDERPFEELVDPLLTTVRPSPMTPPLPDPLDTSWVGFVFSVVYDPRAVFDRPPRYTSEPRPLLLPRPES